MHRPKRPSVPAVMCAVVGLIALSCKDDRNLDSAVTSTGMPAATVSQPPPRVSPGERTSTNNNSQPVHSGVLVYGLEADTATPWAPYRASCSASCRAVLKSISDPLFSEDPHGDPVPVLVDSLAHNADYTHWTLHIRNGITFHDGTPLDAAAVEFNIESCQHSPLTGPAFAAIDRVEASGQDVIVTTKSGGWAALPAHFGDHTPCGFMFSPTWLASLPDIPQRTVGLPIYDAALAATPADGDPTAPVGLGAFQLESYTPGNGNTTRVVRNPDYWRGPQGITGEDLPYLDGIEFIVAVDEQTRSIALRSRQFDLMMTANGDTIRQFLDDDDLKVDASTSFGDTTYILLNVATGDDDPTGVNTASPLLNINCRRALAHAIDLERYSHERTAGLAPPANGPFPPGAVGYLDDTGYPTYDIPAARDAMDICVSELGTDRITINLTTTNDPFNVESNELIAAMWADAFSDTVDVTITPLEQGQFIGLLLTGKFHAVDVRNHNGSDPDEQRYWWSSGTTRPIGELALNFGRVRDPAIDAALDTIRSDPNPDDRRAAAEAINRRFGAQVWNLWLTWSLWAIIQQPYVNGVPDNLLPDGTDGIGLAYLGLHNINQMWCTNGICQ